MPENGLIKKLTGKTFTLYLVISGSATLPWLAACIEERESPISIKIYMAR